MKLKNRYIFFIVFLLLLVGLISLTVKEKTIVAVCPTFYYLAEEIKENKRIEIVKTESTSESLKLIERGEVDFIISGRALKENEPQMLGKKIGKGYDFIFKDEIIVLEEEMKFIPFYTDLNSEKIINDFKYISEDNLTQVENPYDYLEKGVVIVSLEGPLIGEVVHLLRTDYSRVRLSRLPRIYYFEDMKKKIASLEEAFN